MVMSTYIIAQFIYLLCTNVDAYDYSMTVCIYLFKTACITVYIFYGLITRNEDSTLLAPLLYLIKIDLVKKTRCEVMN